MDRAAAALFILFAVSASFAEDLLPAPSLELMMIDENAGCIVDSNAIPIHAPALVDYGSSLARDPLADCSAPHKCGECDLMKVENFTMWDYRRMFMEHRAPTRCELVGKWRGVNKGLVRMAGVKQFIKEIKPCRCATFGDNIEVHQVSEKMLRCTGWQPKPDLRNGGWKRNGKYLVQPPNHRGPFGHGVIFSYRDGGNRLTDPTRVIVDKVVLLDHDHLLGRASVRVGLLQMPVGYFVLERMD
jgi:hypothetical protein